MDLEEVAASALFLCAAYKYFLVDLKIRKSNKSRRKKWVHNEFRQRTKHDLFKIVDNLLTEQSIYSANFVRMSTIDFEYLLLKISQHITKQDTACRDSIPAKVRLAITLRFLATGETYGQIQDLFKVSTSVISNIVPEVCIALIRVLKNTVMKMPQSQDEWLHKNKDFVFPHCLGILNAKVMKHTSRKEDLYLISLINSDHNFTYADVYHSTLWQNVANNPNLPEDNLPYVFLSNIPHPAPTILTAVPGKYEKYTPQRIFNERFEDSKQSADKTLELMCSVFGVLKKRMLLDGDKQVLVIMTCVLLHNFLRQSGDSREIYSPDELIYGELEYVSGENGFVDIQTDIIKEDEDMRDNFIKYIYINNTME